MTVSSVKIRFERDLRFHLFYLFFQCVHVFICCLLFLLFDSFFSAFFLGNTFHS